MKRFTHLILFLVLGLTLAAKLSAHPSVGLDSMPGLPRNDSTYVCPARMILKGGVDLHYGTSFFVHPTDLFYLFFIEARTETTPDVFGAGRYLNMVWIDTGSSPTEVIQIKAFGNGAFVVLIENSVHQSNLAVERALGVAAPWVYVTLPHPAASLRINLVPRFFYQPMVATPKHRVRALSVLAARGVGASMNMSPLTTPTHAQARRIWVWGNSRFWSHDCKVYRTIVWNGGLV